MSLRRLTRKAVDQATAVPAVVEDYHLGFATVRLGNGVRITNIQSLGVVEPGDSVIIDYSAGSPVIKEGITVFPETEQQTHVVIPVLEIQGKTENPEPPPMDFGVYTGWNHDWTDEMGNYLYPYIPFHMPFGLEWLEYWYTRAYWMRGAFFNSLERAVDYLTIPITGKYIITWNWCEKMMLWYDRLIGPEYMGFARSRVIRVNPAGEEFLLGETKTGYCEIPWMNNTGTHTTVLAALTMGDRLYVEIYYTFNFQYYNLDWYAGADEWYTTRGLALQLIPNSIENTPPPISFIHTYLHGQLHSTTHITCYLIGN